MSVMTLQKETLTFQAELAERIWVAQQSSNFDPDAFLDSLLRDYENLWLESPPDSANPKPIPENNALVKCVPNATQNDSQSQSPKTVSDLIHEIFDANISAEKKAVDMYNKALQKYSEDEEAILRESRLQLTQLEEESERKEMQEARLGKVSRSVDDIMRRLEACATRARLVNNYRVALSFRELDHDHFFGLTYDQLTKERETLKDLLKAASACTDLLSILYELPAKEVKRHKRAIGRILDIAEKLENELVEEFGDAFTDNPPDLETMRRLVTHLERFPSGPEKMVDEMFDVVDESLEQTGCDQFKQVLDAMEQLQPYVYKFFDNPEWYMEALVVTLCQHHLRPPATRELGALLRASKMDEYLSKLFEFHNGIVDLHHKMSHLTERVLLHMRSAVFVEHLDLYPQREKTNLKKRLTELLSQFYKSLMEKNQISMPQSPRLKLFTDKEQLKEKERIVPESLREFYVKNPAKFSEDEGINDALISALISKLEEATSRSHGIVNDQNVRADLELDTCIAVVNAILLIHIQFGLDIGSKTVPSNPPQIEPPLIFLVLVQKAMAVRFEMSQRMHRLALSLEHELDKREKLLSFMRKTDSRLDQQIELGLQKILNAALHWIRTLLGRQRKSEFSDASSQQDGHTTTALKVVTFSRRLFELLMKLDGGGNRETMVNEVGLRFARAIIDNVHRFKYTTTEAAALTEDVKLYVECAKILQCEPLTDELKRLLTLCALLTIDQSGLRDLATVTVTQLGDLHIVDCFLKLRA